jgi:hypothetical protein
LTDGVAWLRIPDAQRHEIVPVVAPARGRLVGWRSPARRGNALARQDKQPFVTRG